MLAWERRTACREFRNTLCHGHLGSWWCCWAGKQYHGTVAQKSQHLLVKGQGGDTPGNEGDWSQPFLLPGLSLLHAVQWNQAHSSGGQQMEGGGVHATVAVGLMWWWLQTRWIAQERYEFVKNYFCHLSLSLSDVHTPWGSGQGCLHLSKGQENLLVCVIFQLHRYRNCSMQSRNIVESNWPTTHWEKLYLYLNPSAFPITHMMLHGGILC